MKESIFREKKPENRRETRFDLIVLFFLWPFLSFLLSLKFNKNRYAKLVFLLFCIFFGYTFAIPEDKIDAPDSARYATQLAEMHSAKISFGEFCSRLYSEYIDIYQPLSTWIFSKFTNNPNILFAFFGLIFGIFYANNIWLVISHIKRINYSTFIFLAVFILLNPLWNINGVRMYTAAQIFIYGIILISLNSEKLKGIIWVLVSVFVHFSFIFPVIVLFVYYLIPKRTYIFTIFFFISLIVSELSISTQNSITTYLPEVFQYRIEYYTNSDYVKLAFENASKVSWHIKLTNYVLKYGTAILLFTIIIISNYHKQLNKKHKGLLFMSLFFLSWANIASIVPSGNRFLTIAYCISFIFFLIVFNEVKLPSIANRVKIVFATILVVFFVHSIRVGIDYMSISTLLGNSISVLLTKDNASISNFFN